MVDSLSRQQTQDEQRKLEKICANTLIVGGALMSITSWVDSSAGLFTAWDNYLTALTSPLLVISGLLIYLRPAWFFGAVMLSVVPAMVYQQGVFVTAIHFPGSASLYSAMSSGPFFPLLYVVLFISLPKGATTISAIHCLGYYLQFFLNVMVWPDASLSPERQQAEHLLLEVMTSHPVYVVALSYIVKLRERLHRAQQEAFEHRENLLAIMSHEIRNQLQTMLGAIEILELQLRQPATRRPLVHLQNAATQLQTYLADITELTRLDNPRLIVEESSFDLTPVLEDLRDEWQPLAAKKSVQFSLQTPPSIPLKTDKVRLRQILSNLLSNAVKYTESGSVLLEASATPSGAVDIAVVDTGIGFDAEGAAKIFQPHVRLANAKACCAEGSGLGLAIAERLAQSISASLSVHSLPGEGSRFGLRLEAPAVPGYTD